MSADYTPSMDLIRSRAIMGARVGLMRREGWNIFAAAQLYLLSVTITNDWTWWS